MYYKTTIKKENQLKKRFILESFDFTGRNYRNERGDGKEISLHCIYDFREDLQKFLTEDVDFYLKINEETENVKQFILEYDFEEIKALPNKAKHILGIDYPSVKVLQWR